MDKKLKIILANAPINSGNKGCVALSISMIYLIDKIMKESGRSYKLYLPDSQWEDCQKHTITIADVTIDYYDCMYTSGTNFKHSIYTFFLNIQKALSLRHLVKNEIKDADFILDLGQGDSFSDIYGEYRFRFIDRIHKLANKYRIPYCLLPQTIGPFADSRIKNIANKAIKKAAMCMARDKQSYDYVIKNIPGQTEIKEYIDVAFFLPYEKIQQPNNYRHVGINISSLLWNGGYTNNNQFGLKCDYQELIRNIIFKFLEIPDVKVHIVPHVVLQERDVENDYAVSYDLWREINNERLVLAPFALGPSEIKSYIAGMDFFMGARMHSTIAAFSSGVPVVPMAYSRKFNGLFEDSLEYHHMVDMKGLDVELATRKILKEYRNADVLKKEISQKLDSIVKNKGDLFIKDLTSFLMS